MEGSTGNLFSTDQKKYIVPEKHIIIAYYYHYTYVYNVHTYDVIDSDGVRCGVYKTMFLKQPTLYFALKLEPFAIDLIPYFLTCRQ